MSSSAKELLLNSCLAPSELGPAAESSSILERAEVVPHNSPELERPTIAIGIIELNPSKPLPPVPRAALFEETELASDHSWLIECPIPIGRIEVQLAFVIDRTTGAASASEKSGLTHPPPPPIRMGAIELQGSPLLER